MELRRRWRAVETLVTKGNEPIDLERVYLGLNISINQLIFIVMCNGLSPFYLREVLRKGFSMDKQDRLLRKYTVFSVFIKSLL